METVLENGAPIGQHNVFSDLMLPVPTFPQWLFIALDVTPYYGNLKNRRFRLAMIEISKIEIRYHNKANKKIKKF